MQETLLETNPLLKPWPGPFGGVPPPYHLFCACPSIAFPRPLKLLTYLALALLRQNHLPPDWPVSH